MVVNQIDNKYNLNLLTPDKITEIFYIADDFCKELEQSALKSPFLVNDGKNAVIILA